eukprot:COSAG06_NODE_50289_length_319_cov_3.590909_1_plen_70_part_01
MVVQCIASSVDASRCRRSLTELAQSVPVPSRQSMMQHERRTVRQQRAHRTAAVHLRALGTSTPTSAASSS